MFAASFNVGHYHVQTAGSFHTLRPLSEKEVRTIQISKSNITLELLQGWTWSQAQAQNPSELITGKLNTSKNTSRISCFQQHRPRFIWFMLSLTNTPADIALFDDLDACPSDYMQQKTMQKTTPTMPGLHVSTAAQQRTILPGDDCSAGVCCMLCLHLWRLVQVSAILCCFRCEP